MDTVHIRKANYENVDAECPLCKQINRFNRITDLGTTYPITGMDIVCLHDDCKHPFRIISDSGNALFEMLLHDCSSLIDEKRYMQCMINLCQAYECFFALFLRVAFCYAPNRRANQPLDLRKLNADLKDLYNITRYWTYRELLNTFAAVISTHGVKISDDKVAAARLNLPTYAKTKITASISSTKNLKWKKRLSNLSALSINKSRNSVVHKHAYRPSLQEVEAALAETRTVLNDLGAACNLTGDNESWYLSHG